MFTDTQCQKDRKKANIFQYHISNQPKEIQRINLLFISEDEPQHETKYHYCWIKNVNRLIYDQNTL